MKLSRSHGIPAPLLLVAPALQLPLLLVLFVLPGHSTLLQPGIAVAVPDSPFVLAPQRDPVVVAVPPPPSGAYYLDGREVGLDGLRAGLETLRGLPRSVVIRADRAALHARVVAAMEVALGTGLPVVLATSEPRP